MTKIQLSNGRLFDLLAPNPDFICPTEIADVLSVTPRFGGRARFPDGEIWSVAQHCLLVHYLVTEASPSDTAAAVWALLHDAHEAYTGDNVTPFKNAVREIARFDPVSSVERIIDVAVREKFDISAHDVVDHPLVARADQIAMETERAQLMRPGAAAWGKPELARRDFRLCPRDAAAVSREYQYTLRRALEAYHLQHDAQFSLGLELVE